MQIPRLEGPWRMEFYEPAGNQHAAVNGVLIFCDGRWCTLFFTLGLNQSGDWGSAEAGRYEFRGNELTFYHEFTFQGGGGRHVFMTQASQVVEVCAVQLNGQVLEIRFPSGSIVRCRRFPS